MENKLKLQIIDRLEGPEALTIALDSASYNLGSTVRFRLIASIPPRPCTLEATLYYDGDQKPVLVRRITSQDPSQYADLWVVPIDAKTGRYRLSVAVLAQTTSDLLSLASPLASFAVHRQQLAITSVELTRTVYHPGDPLSCVVGLRNQSNKPLHNLRLELCDFHYPWIAAEPGQTTPGISLIAENITVESGQDIKLYAEQPLRAPDVTEPSAWPYVVIAWDQTRSQILHFAITPPVFVSPHGKNTPKAYPPTQVHSRLESLNTDRYRRIHPQSFAANPISFENDHTLFPEGATGQLKFSIAPQARCAKIQIRLLDAAGRERQSYTLPERQRKTTLHGIAEFQLPEGVSGLFQLWIELRAKGGALLAANSLEISANPLPRSVLIFCAHQDDEMAHPGIIRATVENQIPLDVVYLTNGDAGGSERYFQRICGPSEAAEFGTVRREESTAALGHLGIAPERLHFLGLPDGGCEQIWLHHEIEQDPYWSVLLASDHAPYPDLVRPNLPYARQSVVDEIKNLIRRLQPQVIYAGHPDERHADHRVNSWFVIAALQELRREGALPPGITLLVDQSYGPAKSQFAPFTYQPHVFHVPAEAEARIQEASWFYQSQGGNQGQGNTLPLDQLPREERHLEVLDWANHVGWNEPAKHQSEAA